METDALSPNEGGGLSAKSDNDSVFSFICEADLQEAQEFRRQGYNRQLPEVDRGLMTQLCDALATAKSRLCLQASVGGPLGSLWLLEQIGKIERITGTLSEDRIQGWIKHELSRKSSGGAEEAALGSRRIAQSLARRLESTLRMLTRVVHTLRVIDDYSTPEKRRDMLVAELTDAFSSHDVNTVIQALERMTSEVTGNATWSSLMQARAAAWEADKSTPLSSMIESTRREAEKANKKARDLSGDSQTFFRDIAAYIESLSSDLKKMSINASQIGSSRVMPDMNNHKMVAPSPRSDLFLQWIRTGKLKGQIVVAEWEVIALRLVRIMRNGNTKEILSKEPEHVVADSIIRSILWQWQQPAIKIQYASAALFSKVKELKQIEGVFLPDAVADERGSEQEGSEISASHTAGGNLDVQVMQWVNENLEQEKPENQRAAKLAALERLLSVDIASGHNLVKRLGKTEESIQNMLRQQRFAVLKMTVRRLPAVAPALNAVDKLLPDITKNLTASIVALDKALQLAEYPTRDFAEAKKQADYAQLLARKVKERLSAESARLTERPLDEHSRGSRLAKHWANLAKEQNLSSYPPPDTESVFSSLKRQGLFAGTLSTGDPEGYLFATRLAGELENARNDELRLPMSPEQYAALEKDFVEYIVKWGQRRISRGITRIVIELSFEQALDVVSFNVSNLFRLPYKVLKASIKIPYNVNKINNYTMPGHDKPYKAIYGLLGKKLKQLGYNLLTAPVPGVVKLAYGAGVTSSAVLHNKHVGSRDKTFSAVYQRVVEGEQSKKIKLDSVMGMVFDGMVDTPVTAAFKGAHRGWQSGLQENAAGEDMAVGHSSPLQPQTDVKSLSDEHNPDADLPHVRHRRAVANTVSAPSPQWHNNIPSDATLQSEHFDFDRDNFYQMFSGEQKKQVYLHAIQFVLLNIENDERFSKEIRDNAYLARIGGRLLVPVDIKGYKINNTIFLPDRPGSKTGVIIRLDSELPYYYVGEGKDLLDNIKWGMPHNSDKRRTKMVMYPGGMHRDLIFQSGVDILNNIRAGKASFEENFNYNNPDSMDMASLSAYLADTMDADYQLKGITITNKLLIPRAIVGAHIPDHEVNATEVKYRLELTAENLTFAEYLRSLSRPFSTLSGQAQLVSSAYNGETIQETESYVDQAKSIGSWIDVTTGAILSATPPGWLLNTAQSVADIAADLAEGKDPDPLAVAGLVVGCIPGGRISAKVGKFTRIGAKTVKYGVMIGNKSIDLTIVGRSIATAVETGEPLAIYQALLASGMSVKNSYDMAKNMSPELKINRKMEGSSSLKALKAIHNYTPESFLNSTMTERKFRVGEADMLGRINNGEIEISKDNGITWGRGSKLHLLIYRLQNAGGQVKLNGITYNDHEAVRTQAQDLNVIKTNQYEIYSLNPASKATLAQQKTRRDFESGEREYNNSEFSQFDTLNLAKKMAVLKSGILDGQTLSHRLRGALWKKAHDQFWEDQAGKQILRGQKWVNSALRKYNASTGEVSPQGAYLKGSSKGECQHLTTLMAQAQREGKGSELARNLTGLFNDPDNALGTSLRRLGKGSGIKGEVIDGVKLSALEKSERPLFPGSTDEAISVRLELKEGDTPIPSHVVLLSKRTVDSGNYIYSYFDPNYGYVEFNKYNDMANFVKKRVQIKKKSAGGYENNDWDVVFTTVNYKKLDEVTRTDQ